MKGKQKEEELKKYKTYHSIKFKELKVIIIFTNTCFSDQVHPIYENTDERQTSIITLNAQFCDNPSLHNQLNDYQSYKKLVVVHQVHSDQ